MSGYKDPQLSGIYIRRCKCGLRPYYDRINPYIPTDGCWIACNCGKIGVSGISKEEAIENWNNNKFEYNE